MKKREDLNIELLKEKLLKELESLKGELISVGRINPDNPKDWEPVPAKMDTSTADPNEAADKIEEYEANTAILKELEYQFNEVKRALSEIESGEYGFCKVCGEAISKERLEVNPSAKTCLAHSEK